MTPAFIMLTVAPKSAPKRVIVATRQIAAVVPYVAPEWTAPDKPPWETLRVDGMTYTPPNGYPTGFPWEWDMLADAAPEGSRSSVVDIRPVFDRWLDANRERLRNEHDDTHAGGCAVLRRDGTTRVVLESFDHVAKLLGVVQ